MRNTSFGETLKPLPFDSLAGLAVIEPRNRMEQCAAWAEYELARHRFDLQYLSVDHKPEKPETSPTPRRD